MQPNNVQFRLYVAGQGPNSRLAIANLATLCDEHLQGRHEVEVVDVFEHPDRALQDGILLTPQLVILSATPVQSIIGNLSHTQVLLRALHLPSEAL